MASREEQQEAALAELIRFQDELPASWRNDDGWVLDDPEDFAPIPEWVAEVTIDLREVLESWEGSGDPGEDVPPYDGWSDDPDAG